MNKKYIFLLLILLLFPSKIFASSIESISMNIYIDNNGTAHVTEDWTAYINDGTEGYKPYYNFGNSRFTNFRVSLNGTEYTYTDNWKVNASFDEKKYRNGINYIDDGLELCFGLSKYGNNVYTLSYDITNFVVNTSDGYQMVYWNLFPYNYNPSPGRVYIKIYSDFAYPDTLDVWGYGKGGAPTYVYDGYIEMDSEGKVSSSEYMTILVKFLPNTFNVTEYLDKDFLYYLNLANTGSEAYTEEGNLYLYVILFIIIWLSIFGGSLYIQLSKPKYGSYKIDYGKTKKKFKEVPYFRDLPYKKEELSRGYWLACQYDLVKKNTDYLGALLLKWLKLGNIRIQKNAQNDSTIVFNDASGLSKEEIKLYNMMYEASKDGILEKKEFTSWCGNNYTKILDWFNRAIDSVTLNLVDEGKLLKKKNSKKCTITPAIYEEAKKLAGLKKFLNDFSNIKDKSAIEVNLWDEYLMYAQIFGIAKKVMKEFKNLYPEVITEEVYQDINFIYYVSYNGVNKAISSRNKASSYSSGGGGFSSSGGGGGSFGGGGGGGGIR